MITQSQAFIYTLALELPVVLILGRFWKVSFSRCLTASLIANCLSHPVAWSIAMHIKSTTYHQYGWHLIELSVLIFEAVILGWIMRLRPWQAILISLLANGLSAIVGRLISSA